MPTIRYGELRRYSLRNTIFATQILERKMPSSTQNQIDRISKEIAQLQKTDAQLAKKEADLVAKKNRATEATYKTRSSSVLQSKAREVERTSKELANVQKKRAEISVKISAKSKSLNTHKDRQLRDAERERNRIEQRQKNLIREREQHERRITREIQSRAELYSAMPSTSHQYLDRSEVFDFFISHASEDKDGFVREFASLLQERGAKVWYDEFTLSVGDSLRRKIDQGLVASRYGIVIVSKNFFAKDWPQRELDGLVNLEAGGITRILPIWHEISKDEVKQYSPTLADKVALNTSVSSTEEIAAKLIEMIELSIKEK